MPNHKATEKSLKTIAKRRLRNRMVKSRIRTMSKQVLSLVQSGNKEEAAAFLRIATSEIDRAAKCKRIHKKAAARRKSRLAKHVFKMA